MNIITRKNFRYATFITLSILFILTGNLAHADWVNSWFDHAVIDSSSSYNNQQRGFYSAGGFSGRFDSITEHPLTISTPRISAGCGGIDGFMGGVSFLDADYLVEKLQSIMQAAPAVAFDMALKTMCKECSETLVKLESVADWLNGIQLNECALSKRLVATVSQGDPNILSAMWGEMTSDVSLSQAIDRSWQEAQENVRANHYQPTVDLKTKTNACSKTFKAIFTTGSVIAHASDNVGMSAYADVIRGYIGDVYIRADEADKIPISTSIEPCPQNQQTSLEDMLYGRVYAKKEDGSCNKDSPPDKPDSVIAIVRSHLESIADKIPAQIPLTRDEEEFINATPNIPVYAILRKAFIKDNVDAEIDMMTELVAINYTWYLFNDLYRNTDTMFRAVENSLNNPGVTPNNPDNQCDMSVYAQATTQFKAMHDVLLENKNALALAYQQKISAYLVALQFQKLHSDDDSQLKTLDALNYET
jgi:conjugative transfer pilus assembly protein TraH